MKSMLPLVALGALLGAAPAWGQEQIVVGGAGSLVPAVQELAKAYGAKNPADRIEVMTTSLGSTGGLKAAEAGRVAIALTGRALRPEEKGKLVYRQIGRVPVVFAVHGGVPVTGLQETQICDIYAGRIRSWKELGGPDTKIVLLTRNEDDSTKEAVRKHVGCYKTVQERPEVIVLTSSKAMVDALSNRPGTIGITELGAVMDAQGQFKAVAIDGVAPAADAVRAGRYRVVKEFGVATLGEPRGLARRFLDFAQGPDGERILSQEGVVAAR